MICKHSGIDRPRTVTNVAAVAIGSTGTYGGKDDSATGCGEREPERPELARYGGPLDTEGSGVPGHPGDRLDPRQGADEGDRGAPAPDQVRSFRRTRRRRAGARQD